MKFMNEEDRYTALCAYVLGEAEPDERVAIEAELAESAELRAQRDELEATIGLVRTSLGDGDERLSATVHDEVLRAAQVRRPRWQVLRTPWLAAAAGLAAVAFGWYVLDAGRERAAGSLAPADQVARLDALEKKEQARGKALEADLHEEIAAEVGLGELRDAPASAPAPAEQAADSLLRMRQEELARSAASYSGLIHEQSVARARLDEEGRMRERMLGLGYSEGGVAPAAVAPTEGMIAGKDQTYTGPGDTAPSVPATKLGHAAERTQPLPSQAETQLFDSALVQVLEEPVLKDLPKNEVVAVGGGAGGKFGARAPRGAGGSAPASPGPSGPAGPALQPQASHGSSGFFDEGSSDEESKLLTGLGYVGDDGDDASTGTDDFFIGRSEARKGSHAADFAKLPPEERERLIDLECQRIIERTRRRPNEQPGAMYFRYWGDNPFELTALDAQSTFGVDVDTASYALVRNYLRQGMIPPREAVRTEEFVNYFAPDLPAPTEGTFAIRSELAPSRYGDDPSRWMLEVVVRGREVAREERKPLSLTFVVDTSGSMSTGNRIEMVKHALRLLLAELDGNDTVAIVAFSNEARLVLPPTPAAQRGLIESAIHPLAPNGGTNAEAGLVMGYEAALTALRAGANNRVVFLSDGVANIGQTDQDRITAEVARLREQGIYLNTIGVGMGNHNDALLEQLANRGDGVCNYIDSPAEAHRALVENFTGQFEPIARDVKVQVEFDPAQVIRWRLLGYENRAIADKDFRNDAVDAGELGSGHQVVALYEIERTMAAADAPLATVRLRWKAPYEAGRGKAALEAGDEASEVEQPVFARGTSWEGTDAGYKRAVLVAQFAEILRRSSHARGDSLDALLRDLEPLARDGDADLRELFELVRQSRELILRSLPSCDELCLTIDEVRRWNLRQAELELMRVERDQQELDELARRNAELEQRIRELVRRKYAPAQPR